MPVLVFSFKLIFLMRYNQIYSIVLGIALLMNGCVEDSIIEGGLKNAKKPTVETLEILGSSASTVSVSGEVVQENGAPVTTSGFCWGNTADFVFQAKQSKTVSKRKAKFETTIEGLIPNHNYYIKAFAINEIDTAFGDVLSFKTTDGLGSVKTLKPTHIFATKVECGGVITTPGEATVEKRGIYLMTNATPSDTDSLIVIPMETDSFYCTINGLKPQTTYYLRAYAANKFGTYNGAQIESFTTTDGLPSLDKKEFKLVSIDYQYADFQLAITNEGDSPVTQWGFCFSNSEYPTIEKNDTVVCGNGIGTFIGRIAKMEQQKEYYVRGYATNSIGTRYTDGAGIRTVLLSMLPTLNTDTVGTSQIKDGYIVVGGEVLAEGVSPVKESGVCWSTKPQVNLTNSIGHKALGSGAGLFSGQIEGLRGGTTYYLRTYATNEEGTEYGEEISFTTPDIITAMKEEFEGGHRMAGSTAFTVINNIGILLGGDNGATYSNQLWAYIAGSRNEWMQLRSQPKALSEQILFSQGFGMWAFGGLDESGRVTNELYFYSTLSNLWEIQTEDQITRPQGLYRAASCVQDGIAYLIGGRTENDSIATGGWAYDISSSNWFERPNFPIAQFGGVALSIENTLYAGLGITSRNYNSATYSQKLWSSTDGAQSWQEETSFPGKGLLGATTLHYYIYGVDTDGYIWRYNTQTKIWEKKTQLSTAQRSFHCIFVLNEKIYIGLGTGSNTLVKYDPVWDN